MYKELMFMEDKLICSRCEGTEFKHTGKFLLIYPGFNIYKCKKCGREAPKKMNTTGEVITWM